MVTLSAVVILIGVLIANSKSQAIAGTKLEELTWEVWNHNNFGQRLSVLKEKSQAVNHHIEDVK